MRFSILPPLRLVVGTALLALSFNAFSGAAGNPPIIIGQAIDLSGPDASIGRDYVAGIKTCFDMVNATGGVNGRKIHYLVRDDRGQADRAAEVASDLIERNQADVLLGGVGDVATEGVLNAPAFRRSGHILFAPLAAAEHVGNARVLYWRPSYRQELNHIFRHFSKLGMQEVALVYQESGAQQDSYRNLSAIAREHGMKLTHTVRLDTHAGKIASEAERLASTRPGFVLVVADSIGTALFLKQYRKHDQKTFVAGTSLTNLSTLRELAGAQAVEWTVFSQVVPNPNAGTTLLQLEHMDMMRKYRDESLSSLTLEGFAAAKALVKVLQQAKRPRTALQEFIAQQASIDLGGLAVTPGTGSNRLSSYLDIALLKKGSGLIF
ncbi:ABC transporter substrate-binding protein [Noviherbaspirillum saxi]|nr:ABC transporter substrate-binding protein [Noviherbaspirillum saxi]